MFAKIYMTLGKVKRPALKLQVRVYLYHIYIFIALVIYFKKYFRVSNSPRKVSVNEIKKSFKLNN